MKFIFCILSLIAIATFLDVVQADYEQDVNDELRNNECLHNIELCQKQAVTKVTIQDVMGLCNAKPLANTSTKCLMDCKMQEKEWMNKDEFNVDKYLEYIKKSNLGQDGTYVQAAQQAAYLCKDVKAPFGDSCETAFLILKCLQDEGNKKQKINLGYGIFYVEPFFMEFDK